MVETPDGSPNGALREAETAEVILGVQVGDLDAIVARCVELGGSVVMPSTDNGYVNTAQIARSGRDVVTLVAADKSEPTK